MLIGLIFAVAFISFMRIDSVCGLAPEDLPELPDTTPAAVQTVTQPEPKAPLYDIPLSSDLQEYTYQKCIQYDVDYVMVLAIMQEESGFKTDAVSPGGDCGIMQIRKDNMKYLEDALGVTDLMDPKQNIEAGIFWLSGICKNNTDPERILMVYNMGGNIAQDLWDMGRYSTGYSREVMRFMDEISAKPLTV
jgi:soluble lytic murein transglycosylase-like protein